MTPPSHVILASGLAQFPSIERYQILEALRGAREVMLKATRPEPLPDDEMQVWFGPAYSQYSADVLQNWNRVAHFLMTYSQPSPGYDKFQRIMSLDSTQYALIDREDPGGMVGVDSGFFDSGRADTERVSVLLHELSHLGAVSGVSVEGPQTWDFFYLEEGNQRGDSDKIVNRGLMAASDLEEPVSLFNEIAAIDGLVVEHVDDTIMRYSRQQRRDFMVPRQARNEFETRPLLRARVASRNADSLAYSAMAIASRR